MHFSAIPISHHIWFVDYTICRYKHFWVLLVYPWPYDTILRSFTLCFLLIWELCLYREICACRELCIKGKSKFRRFCRSIELSTMDGYRTFASCFPSFSFSFFGFERANFRMIFFWICWRTCDYHDKVSTPFICRSRWRWPLHNQCNWFVAPQKALPRN